MWNFHAQDRKLAAFVGPRSAVGPLPRVGGMRVLVLLTLLPLATSDVGAQPPRKHRCIFPEQRGIRVRPPEALDHCRLPPIRRPPTVSDPQEDRETVYLSLDDAIRIALENAEIIRVLVGTTASSSGQTVYDPAVVNTEVDQAKATFDPRYESSSNLGRTETPAVRVPVTIPPFIDGITEHSYDYTGRLAQTKPWGGRVSGGFTLDRSSIPGAILDPATRTALDLRYDQPLLRGRGVEPNLAPIVIAKIDTERSVYQLKDAVQELVRSVIEGYWGIVFSRIDVWAREQQVEQLEEAYRAFEVQRRFGRADVGDSAQAAVSLANFRATLIASKADLLNREEALRNALGLPPGTEIHFVPSTPPITQRRELEWERLLRTAEVNRPDVIELKLALEADRQRLIRADNQALPQLDASALYRFNGLGGEDAFGNNVSSSFGQFGDWNVGLTLDLPVTLRADRASLRQAELVFARDRANLQQELHNTSHLIAQSLRNLDQFYDQYEAFRKVRESSRTNLEKRFAVFDVGGLQTERVTIVELLLAITDWGNAVSAEAQALAQYNAELANLDRQTGVILERHGVVFQDEGYRSIGPCWPWLEDPCYAKALYPTENSSRYEDTGKASDDAFNLQSPVPKTRRDGQQERLPPVEGDAPTSAEELMERYMRELEAEEADSSGFLDRSLELPPQFTPEQMPPQEDTEELAEPDTGADRIDPNTVLPPLELRDRIRRTPPITPTEPRR